MIKFKGSEEYINGDKLFVAFAVSNSTNKEFIVCPCKNCKLNKRFNPQLAYTHLIGGIGILLGYAECVWHEERMCNPVIQRESTVEGSSLTLVPDESRTMNAILHDVFGMHKSITDEFASQMEVQPDVVGLV